MTSAAKPIIEVKDIVNQFGAQKIHDHVSFTINEGEILGIVGGSGSGKSVLVRTIIGLQKPQDGQVIYKGQDLLAASTDKVNEARRRWGIMFQHGALFSSLTVLQNIMTPLKEFTNLSDDNCAELAMIKLSMAGLKPEAAHKFPAELSGGMVKRAALARALALDPDVLFLDEPTAGLDPIGAAAFDDLIRELAGNTKVTIVMVTHDLDTLFSVCDRVGVLVDKKIMVDTIPKLMESGHKWVHEYFHGARARAVIDGKEGAVHGN